MWIYILLKTRLFLASFMSSGGGRKEAKVDFGRQFPEKNLSPNGQELLLSRHGILGEISFFFIILFSSSADVLECVKETRFAAVAKCAFLPSLLGPLRILADFFASRRFFSARESLEKKNLERISMK